MFTQWIWWQFPSRVSTIDANDLGCKLTLSTPTTGSQKSARLGLNGKKQREAAVTLVLALWQQFSVDREDLKWVEVFKYLGRLPAQEDDDIQAIHAQLQKACAIWAQVGQVLWSENAPPHVATTFYKVIVQAILLYGSKTWVLSWTALAHLEGFHICVAYQMAKMHKPKRGPGR
jgi:hypothetical protein